MSDVTVDALRLRQMTIDGQMVAQSMLAARYEMGERMTDDERRAEFQRIVSDYIAWATLRMSERREGSVRICVRCGEPVGWCMRHGCTGDPTK